MDAARQYAKKLTLVNLADGAGTGNEIQNMALDDMPMNSNSGGISNSNSSSNNNNNSTAKQQTNVTQASAYLHQQLASQTSSLDNQRVHLVKALVAIGDYTTALRLIDRLPQWYLSFNADIAASVCHSLDTNFIDNMYRKLNLLSKYLRDKYTAAATTVPSNSAKSSLHRQSSVVIDVEMTNSDEAAISSILDEFTERILPILCALGPGLAYDTVLLTKLIRIYTAFLDAKKLFSANSFSSSSASAAAAAAAKDDSNHTAAESPSSNNNKGIEQALKALSEAELRFYNSVYTVLNEVFMPSLAMLSSNPCIAIELWNLVKVFPYEMRYHIYNNWKLLTYKQFPNLIRARADCQEKIKYLLK
jgi:THO complex subunit 2